MIYSKQANQTNFPFVLPELPYNKNDLIPFMSHETFEYHYGKHHNGYVTNLNKIIEGKESLQTKTLEELILFSCNDKPLASLFNNAAQVWNHTFFWHSMKKDGGGRPDEYPILKEMIGRDFGSYEEFSKEFSVAATTQFGSGWAWLVVDNEKLKVIKTSNAETPLTLGYKPLICCDVWEHAYYIDYKNDRLGFVSSFITHLLNWDFAASNLGL